MNTHTDNFADLIQNLTDDERAFIAAEPGSSVALPMPSIRRNVEAAISAAKDTGETVQRKWIQGAQAAEAVMQNNPHQTIGMVFVVGFAAGYILTRSIR